MKTILQRQVELATAHGPKWVSSPKALGTGAAAFAAVVLGPLAMGVCGCTMLTLGSFLMILACALSVGNSAITALAEERERKTLVFLRLTLLSAPQVMLLKMIPEFLVLRSVLVMTVPALLICGLVDGSLLQVLYDVFLAVVTGTFAAAAGIYLSTMFQTKSKAVVGGWIFKAVWLLLTPLFDAVLAAVAVQTTPPPVFTSLNPLADWWFSTVPETAVGAQLYLSSIGIPVMLLVSALMIFVAARRFDAGLIVGNVVGDEQIHGVYEKGWGPKWLQARFPVLRHNPLFLRELAVQMRGGAGRWPGYAVFAVLFLAPFMYARLWATKDADLPTPVTPHVTVGGEAMMATEHQSQLPTAVSLTRDDGTRLVLVGHKPLLCFRLLLNQVCDVPLPANQVKEVRITMVPNANGGVPSQENVTYTDPQTGMTSAVTPITPQAEPIDYSAINRSSLAWGFTGAVFMLLVYIGIRCSGFLATAVTGERDRRSWEDLALTILQPGEAMLGKTVGSLLLPIVQMTATFPLLLFFVFNGSLSVVEVGFLYAYAIALAVAAGMLGLWSSSVSNTSHEAHARALMLGFLLFVVAPAVLPLALAVAAFAVVRGLISAGQSRFTESVAWLAVAAGLGLMPSAASPMTAVLSFMPSLNSAGASVLHNFGAHGATDPFLAFACSMATILGFSALLWRGVLSRLHEPDQEVALRTQFAQ